MYVPLASTIHETEVIEDPPLAKQKYDWYPDGRVIEVPPPPVETELYVHCIVGGVEVVVVVVVVLVVVEVVMDVVVVEVVDVEVVMEVVEVVVVVAVVDVEVVDVVVVDMVEVVALWETLSTTEPDVV